MQRNDLTLIAILASLTRVFWVRRGLIVRAGDHPYDASSDAGQYLIAAKNLRVHHVFSFQPDLIPTYFRAPGYSMMISLLWGNESTYPIKAILITQAVLGVSVAILTYLIAKRFGRRVAIIAGIGMALAPMSGVFVGELLTEVLYTFLITLAIFFWSRDKSVWAGLIFGLSWLVRPTTMAFLIFAILATIIYRAHARQIALMSLIALFTVTPWIARNAITFHRLIPVAVAGGRMNLFFGTMDIQYGKGVWEQALNMPDAMPAYGWDDPRSEDVYFQKAVERIKADPLRWIGIRIKQYPRLLIDLGAYLYPQSRTVTLVLKSLFLIGNITVLLLAIFGGYLARSQVELILFPIFILLFHIPLWVEPRYSLPMMPMVAILASVGVVRLALLWPVKYMINPCQARSSSWTSRREY
jgi:4-amino-4-deoxy-L-arabinose transferase-like glycosyltransferase